MQAMMPKVFFRSQKRRQFHFKFTVTAELLVVSFDLKVSLTDDFVQFLIILITSVSSQPKAEKKENKSFPLIRQ